MEPGHIIAGRYRLDALAGEGGMGTVYRATDLEKSVMCAVKLVRTDSSPLAKERFVEEVSALSSIRHPAVVRYLDHGVTKEGVPFIVMEWVPGDALADRLREECPPLDRALAIAFRLADALVHIHAAGIVHRDLKPRNVMLPPSSWDDARIVDFGIARSKRTSGITQTGVRLGTPRYMAPEQVLHPRKVDGRADVFSLGCILFEMATGQRAYRGGDEIAVLARVVIEDAPRAKRLRPSLPDAVDELLARLLTRDVRRRPVSADAIVAIEEARRFVRYSMEPPPPISTGEHESTHAFSTSDQLEIDSFTLPPASSLPSSRGVFVGRENEIAALDAMLEQPGTVSIWGPMGIGKSRLALETARRLPSDCASFWVDLHPVRDLEGALHTIAVALALPHDDTAASAIAGALASRARPVLVIDGADGVHDEIVALAKQWARAPGSTIVLVSRQRAPLDRTMEIRALQAEPAAELLGLRAAESGADVQVSELGNLARILEGNPLAIELAAVRIPVLGVGPLARRLEKPLDLLGSRLRDSIALSWDLLDDGEKRALAECSLFAGDFSIESAEAILSPAAVSVVDRIQSLRDKSLLSNVQQRGLSLYGAVRDFARSKLGELGIEGRARKAHADHVVDRAELLAAQEGSPAALAELTRLLPDLLVAYAYGLDGSPSLALRAVIASDPVLVARGPIAAHVKRLDAALAGTQSEASLVRKARQARGRALALEGKFDGALADLEFAASGGDVEALLDLGVALKRKTDLAGAERCFRAVLEQRDRIESDRSLARALGNLGAVAHDRWDLDVAYRHYVEAVALAEAGNDPRLLGVFLGNLAVLDQERGGLAAARHRFHRAIRALESTGDRRLLGIYIGNLGTLELERGRADLALAAHERSRELLAEIGDMRSEGLVPARMGATLAVLGRIDEARAALMRAERMVRQDAQSAAITKLLRAFVHRAEGNMAAVQACIEQARDLERHSDEARAAIRILSKR